MPITKILQISDTHIVPRNELVYGRVDTAAALAETVATIIRLLPDIGTIDAILLTGDLTDYGNSDDYDQFISLITPLASLAVPILAVPGNHDKREQMRQAFITESWMPKVGPIQWQLDLQDVMLIGLDSHVPGAPYGTIEEEGLLFLKQAMGKANGKPLLIGFHHPPFETGLAPMDQQNLKNSDMLASLIADYKGDIRIICGHVHRAIAGTFAGRLCLTAPGTSHAVSINLRPDADNSLTREPGGFMLHEWRDGFVSHTIPVGEYDGPHPFY